MWLASLLLLVFAQQNPGVIFQQKNVEGWTALGEGSELRPAGDAFSYTYEVAPKKLSGALMGAPRDMARMRSIRFAIQSDHDTAMCVLLAEKKPGGGNYAAWFWAPADLLQKVELTPADFTITDGAGDPVDADGKLDLDQVEGIAVVDLAQFFLGRPGNPGLPITESTLAGRHTFRLEDFAITTGDPEKPAAGSQSVLLDGFDRGFLDWVALGGMKLQLSKAGDPLGASAVQASYRQHEGELELMVRRVGDPALAKARHLSFDIASERDVTLVVALEMKKSGGTGGEGPRFSVPIYPPGGKEVFHVDLDLADFKGPAGVFDPSQWRTIAIMDATTSESGGEQDNTIWIGKIEARKQ